MNNRKIYLSGKITGLSFTEAYEAFGEAKEKLKKEGWQPVSPIEIGTDAPAGASDDEVYKAHLKADIVELTKCEAIYMMASWQSSEGATLEHDIAKSIGLRIIYEVPPKNPEIKKAIFTVMGVHFHYIAQDSRNRWHVYARMIYAHHAKKQGDNTQQIAAETNHDQSSISYYLRHYDGEYKFNVEFRKVAEKVATLLSKRLSTEGKEDGRE